MDKGYRKLFGHLDLMESPNNLKSQIVKKIETKEKRLQTARVWIFGSSSIASLGLALSTVIYLANSIKQTGFWQYFSLIFSENKLILDYWREFTLSLIESLPIVGLIILLASIGFFVWSFSNTFKRAVSFNNFG